MIAAELVGAGEMGERGSLEPGPDVERVRLVGRQQVGKDRAQDERHDKDQPEQAERVAQQAAQRGQALDPPARGGALGQRYLKGWSGHGDRARR
jgi:hypothetical protein